tara:strand:- start:78 stop:521 length:444 start_codon:yes stop_codon:yes gene_type:complete
MPTLARNKKASFDYDFVKEIEGGLVLTGAEVKAVRQGHIQLKGSYLTVQNGELYLKNAYIAKYAPAGSQEGYDPYRIRKVLVHRKELAIIAEKKSSEGLTIVPVSVYTKGNFIKLGFAIARGKKKHEKRDSIKKRDIERQMRTAMKE